MTINKKVKKGLVVLLILALQVSCKTDTKGNDSNIKETAALNFDALDTQLKEFESKKDLPGFVVAIFNKDSMLFSKGYGYADIENEKLYDENTIQGIASVSKSFISVALMKAVQQGHIDLDATINSYLPYEVINPHYPDVEITVRHLATHTSSFNDEPNRGKGNIFSKKLQKENWREVWHPIIEKYNRNKPEPMDTFLAKMFNPEGEWYSEENFIKHRPGTFYKYSNFASALLAQIIEITTKTDYKEYTKNEIFIPLNMAQTGWSREAVDSINHVQYYNDNYKPVPHYSIITYPDGGVYSSVSDLTLYLQEMMKGYYGESDFLSHDSFKEMMTSQSKLLDTNTGLFWDLDQSCCIGHGGNDFGIAAMMYLDIRDSLGRIVLSNIDVQQENQENAFYGIFNQTFISSE